MLVKPKVYKKGWGRERWLHNSEKYAFKILEFKQGSRSSLHFHMKKTETWFVESGGFEVTVVDGATAERNKFTVTQGAVLHIPPGVPHQVRCFKAGRIFEASTQHFEDDSYRIEKGDSQR